jgi:hypothetical protein
MRNPELTETERRVLGLIAEGKTAVEVLSASGLNLEEFTLCVESAVAKAQILMGVRNSREVVDHSHPHNPMDDEEILSHLRFMHPPGIPRYDLRAPEELRRLHLLLHFEPSPSPA